MISQNVQPTLINYFGLSRWLALLS